MKKVKKGTPPPKTAPGARKTAPRKRWRLLEIGERIQAADQVWSFAHGPWAPVDLLIGCKFDPTFMNKVRREAPSAKGSKTTVASDNDRIIRRGSK